MPFAVVLFFDENQISPINAAIKELADTGVSSFMYENSVPHITLAIYNDISGENGKERLKEFAGKFSSPSVKFSHVGVFSSKMNGVFAAPVVTKSLLKFHQDFHDFFREFGKESWENYRPDSWVPHCTLGFNVPNENVDQALSICREMDLPLCADTASIGVMEFEPVKVLYQFPFKS